VYFRKCVERGLLPHDLLTPTHREGRALGEVTKYLVYNAVMVAASLAVPDLTR
jgi:hypothetical protein